MSEHLAREVQVAEERARVIATLEADVRNIRQISELELKSLRSDFEHGLTDLRSILSRIEEQTKKTNGSVADAFLAIEAIRTTAKETGSRLADAEGDIKELDGKVAGAMTELHATSDEMRATSTAREKQDLRNQTRWEVIKAELRWVAVGWATFAGPVCVALTVAYLKGWIGG